MAPLQLAPIHNKLAKSWYVLAASAVVASTTGGTGEVTFATVTLPAGAMGPNGILQITTAWTYTNNGNSKTWRVRVGTVIGQAIARTVQQSDVGSFFLCNRNNQIVQVLMPSNFANGAGPPSGGVVRTAALDTSVNQSITITGQLAVSTDTITLEGYQVEVYYGA